MVAIQPGLYPQLLVVRDQEDDVLAPVRLTCITEIKVSTERFK